MKITDGTGRNLTAGVNQDNQLQVSSVNASIEHYINHNKGDAYNLIFNSTPVSGGCFVYIKNTSSLKDMAIDFFHFRQ